MLKEKGWCFFFFILYCIICLFILRDTGTQHMCRGQRNSVLSFITGVCILRDHQDFQGEGPCKVSKAVQVQGSSGPRSEWELGMATNNLLCGSVGEYVSFLGWHNKLSQPRWFKPACLYLFSHSLETEAWNRSPSPSSALWEVIQALDHTWGVRLGNTAFTHWAILLHQGVSYP